MSSKLLYSTAADDLLHALCSLHIRSALAVPNPKPFSPGIQVLKVIGFTERIKACAQCWHDHNLPWILRESTYCFLEGTRAGRTRRPARCSSTDPHPAHKTKPVSTELINIRQQRHKII